MGRNLVLCFDGTNNKYAATNTNVVKLYAMLDRTREDQLCYYQTGIGTFLPAGTWGKLKRWYLTKLDLAVAWLLEEHVCDGYRFLMRYYQPGDQIYIFGFSRGAYTARVLAAMLYKVGLLSEGNEEMISFAWDMFKGERDYAIYSDFRHTFSRSVKVKFLGLWDTVSSVGWVWNPIHLQFTEQNPFVEVVRHAVALDERRASFMQNLWSTKIDEKNGQDVQQVWFSGVHCDIGGGYSEVEAGLSKITLKWMQGQAEAFGLYFYPLSVSIILPEQDTSKYVSPSATAMLHESLQGWWWIAEYVPKRIQDPSLNFEARWILHGGCHRYVSDGAMIHSTVFERMEKCASYNPPNLPLNYKIIR